MEVKYYAVFDKRFVIVLKVFLDYKMTLRSVVFYEVLEEALDSTDFLISCRMLMIKFYIYQGRRLISIVSFIFSLKDMNYRTV